MLTYHNSDELTSIAQYFFLRGTPGRYFLLKSFNMETNERTIRACFREKPKQAAPLLLAASLAENLQGKKVLFLYQPTCLQLFQMNHLALASQIQFL